VPSKAKQAPVVVLDVANIGSAKNLFKIFPTFYKHLLKGRVRIVSGGRVFSKELRSARSLLPLFVELSKLNLILKLDEEEVNNEQSNFEQLIIAEFGHSVNDCDDPHLFALLQLAGAKSVISGDKRIGACRKCLRESGIQNSKFANAILISSNQQYVARFNRKRL